MSSSMSSSNSTPIVARLLLPDDANPSGNVHGGTILQLMEQAGLIAVTRYCNSDPASEHQGKQMAGLARIETMSFHKPLHVGEVASLTADIVFTSERSALVKVVVTAENICGSDSRVSDSGLLWYTSFLVPEGSERPVTVKVPKLPPPTEPGPKMAEYNIAKSLYEARKKSEKETTEKDDRYCLAKEGCLCPTCRLNYAYRVETDKDTDKKKQTPSSSHQRLCQMVLPGDCGTSNVAFGGFVMKLMDNAAGCCAFKHCRTNVVTVSISAMDFIDFVNLGDVVTIDATLSFVSAKSMEIEVRASAASMTKRDTPVARGTFTFVSLDKNQNVMAVPTLTFENQEQLEQAFVAQKKYEKAKKDRLAKMS